jgi:hypothetical protein
LSPIYVPILKSKKGEYDALAHLSERATNQIIPWFDIPQLPPPDENTNKATKKRPEQPIESFLDNIALDISKAWGGPPLFFISKSIFMDLPRWAPNAQTENGEHVIPYLRNRLEYCGIIVNPVIRYDIWGDPVYMNAIKGIRLEAGRSFCIRLSMDVDTVADIKADPDYVSERLSDIINHLAIDPAETYLLIDFGDISNQRYFIEELVDTAKQAISLVRDSGFSQVMLAGASLPSSINLAVKVHNSTGLVLRKEMMIWQALLSETPSLNVIFADYGVRNPSSSDESRSCPNANGKIRYTIGNHYFIARGEYLFKGTGIKFQQFRNLAQIVINSGYYLEPKFSWGDESILRHSKLESKGPGNQGDWISIDTNHHIETVLMEILEFRRQLTAKKTHEKNSGTKPIGQS